jgi:hypothetical protein
MNISRPDLHEYVVEPGRDSAEVPAFEAMIPQR